MTLVIVIVAVAAIAYAVSKKNKGNRPYLRKVDCPENRMRAMTVWIRSPSSE